ncbi:RsmB/NOP family class I SAM-dependent RNA methyltransferase [Paenibacillus sp. MBLB4367]|uniref:RsmB/NOP family class I SAM-dependent RNA methyltransferase n=1 Tax=Paenibacillus sp. MBLB4367 TaxID=3384767 RepID=UPI0039080EF9
MAIKLPEAFVERMCAMLGDEFEAFMRSYEEPRYYGLRVNTLKLQTSRFAGELSPFELQPAAWAPDGFYYEEGERPGKHPYYHAGLYYIQEPSAMAPVELLDVKPGERVLDLCAAPGGKSTQIAGKLGGTGLLVSNDNSADRVKALVKNIELSGVRNAVVFNETPERLAPVFAAYFDKILIDAPCSGEGMFRKEEEMAKQWERHSVERCSLMQRDILEKAAAMLKPGGRIVYSTCTFAPEENECRIAAFLDAHPDFGVVPVEPAHGFASGRPDWVALGEGGAAASPAAAAAVRGTVRLWPHRLKGEGHYAAVLERRIAPGGETAAPAALPARQAAAAPQARLAGAERGGKGRSHGAGRTGARDAVPAGPDLAPWLQFAREQLTGPLTGVPVSFGEHLYMAPEVLPDLAGLKVARPGWYAGTLKRGRFEPSHALAMGLRAEQAVRCLNLRLAEPAAYGQAIRYLKGETLTVSPEDIDVKDLAGSLKGYCLVCVDGFPVGWGKWQDGMLKNEYPAGWRWSP